MTAIRANAVMVDKVYQARCHLDGCGWTGTVTKTFQEASTERQDHLDWHRYQEMGAES